MLDERARPLARWSDSHTACTWSQNMRLRWCTDRQSRQAREMLYAQDGRDNCRIQNETSAVDAIHPQDGVSQWLHGQNGGADTLGNTVVSCEYDKRPTHYWRVDYRHHDHPPVTLFAFLLPREAWMHSIRVEALIYGVSKQKDPRSLTPCLPTCSTCEVSFVRWILPTVRLIHIFQRPTRLWLIRSPQTARQTLQNDIKQSCRPNVKLPYLTPRNSRWRNKSIIMTVEIYKGRSAVFLQLSMFVLWTEQQGWRRVNEWLETPRWEM